MMELLSTAKGKFSCFPPEHVCAKSSHNLLHFKIRNFLKFMKIKKFLKITVFCLIFVDQIQEHLHLKKKRVIY